MSKKKIYARDMKCGCCALCKFWYNPTNSAIMPLSGNWWEYDTEMKARCMKTFSLTMKGGNSCGKFKSKV